MKILFTILISLLLPQIILSQPIPFQAIEKIAAGEIKATQKHFRSERTATGTNINVIQQICVWNIDPAVRYISGHVNTLFIPVQTNQTQISLDLSDSLMVDSVLYNDTKLNFTHSDNLLQIDFPTTLVKGNLYNADIYYHGIPGNSGFGSFVQMKHGPDSIPALWTLSEPFGASDWFPCKNSLEDKVDSLDIIVTTPEAYQCAANGVLISTVTSDNKTTYHWKHRYPIATYLIGIAVTKYFIYTDRIIIGGDTLNVMNFVWREDSLNARTYIPDLYPAMAIFDSLFGEYPFKKEKYGHAQFGWGGGMEHQTISFVTDFSFDLLAHECAHQWFGDKITCGSWSDIFLNEGFAVFATGLCYQNLFDGQWWYPWRRKGIDLVTSKPNGSIYVNNSGSLGNIFDYRTTYVKGGLFLHQLRYQIGEKAFFKGIKEYINDTSLIYQFANIENLQKHLEKTSDKDLTYYFDQWYYGQGYPSYRVEWSQNENGKVRIILGQTQSDKSVPFFKLLVPVQLKNSNNDTIILLDHKYSGEEFEFTLPFTIDSLIIDPELHLISANNVVQRVPALSDKSNVIMYPNPSDGSLTISFSNMLNPLETIELYDILGRKILYSSPVISPDQISVQYDFSSLAKGTYFLRIVTKETVLIKKWVKTR